MADFAMKINLMADSSATRVPVMPCSSMVCRLNQKVCQNMPQVIYKPHCHYQNFSVLTNGLYLIVITNKTLFRNGNCPITDPITEMGVAHTVGLWTSIIFPCWLETCCSCCITIGTRVCVEGVKSLGGHFACLCRGFEFYEGKNNNFLLLFFKKKMEIRLHF